MKEPGSLLTLQRPDIWAQGLALATSLTGLVYAPKLAKPNGEIWAYNEGSRDGLQLYGTYEPPPPTEEQRKRWEEERAERRKRDKEIEEHDKLPETQVEKLNENIRYWESQLEQIKRGVGGPWMGGAEEALHRYIKEAQKKIAELTHGPSSAKATAIFVPEGAMEWLLHEVGHWLVATPTERQHRDYGLGDTSDDGFGRGPDCEWRAWAFEEIILAPFGPARGFAPPTQRDGVAFARTGPLPPGALDDVARLLREHDVDVEPWRLVWGDWVRWGNSIGHRAPWKLIQ